MQERRESLFWQSLSLSNFVNTSLNLCYLGNVKSFFLIFFFSHFLAGYHGNKVRSCTVQQALFFNGFAQTSESPHPNPCLLILISSSSIISSFLLFLSVFLFQLSFLHSLIHSVSLCFILIDLWLTTVCGRSISMGPHSHRQRNEDTHTHSFC